MGGPYRTWSHHQLEEGGIKTKHPQKSGAMQALQEAEECHSDKTKLKQPFGVPVTLWPSQCCEEAKHVSL